MILFQNFGLEFFMVDDLEFDQPHHDNAQPEKEKKEQDECPGIDPFFLWIFHRSSFFFLAVDS
jgi:hypothetical protein